MTRNSVKTSLLQVKKFHYWESITIKKHYCTLNSDMVVNNVWKYPIKSRTFQKMQLHLACQYITMCVLIKHILWKFGEDMCYQTEALQMTEVLLTEKQIFRIWTNLHWANLDWPNLRWPNFKGQMSRRSCRPSLAHSLRSTQIQKAENLMKPKSSKLFKPNIWQKCLRLVEILAFWIWPFENVALWFSACRRNIKDRSHKRPKNWKGRILKKYKAEFS